MSDRIPQIAHLDLDCFFVSVERITDPTLIGKPVAVGGTPDGRGVVASASYEARAFGVRSAMPMARALKLCPSLIVVRGHHGEYGRISDRLYHRICELAPLVERASIDEMYMDFTGCESLYGNDLPGFMHRLQMIVRTEFQLPCTIALASNKTVAKIAANAVKPAGVIAVPHGTEKDYLASMNIGVIPGIGKKTEEFLQGKGFRIVADLQARTEAELVALLGSHGSWISAAASGRGSTHIGGEEDAKSISREETFARDIGERQELERELHVLTEDVCSTLRSHGWKARTITLKLRYSDFTTVTHGRTVEPTNEDPLVFRAVCELLEEAQAPGEKIRLVGVRLSNFHGEEQMSLGLFPQDRKKQEVLKVVDSLRDKFGDGIIHLGKPQ